MNIIWVVILTVASGIFAGLATNMMWERAKRHATLPVIAGLIAAAVICTLLVQTFGAPSGTGGNEGSVTPEPHTSSPPPPSLPTSSPSPTAISPTATTTAPAATSLLDLTWARESVESTIDIEFRSTISIDGTTHDEALVFDCNIWCSGTSPQVYEVTLGRNFKTFTATAAVLDEYNGEHSFAIALDQREPQSFTTSPGNAVPIKLDVEGVTRLRVLFHRTAAQEATIATHQGIYMGMALASPMVLP